MACVYWVWQSNEHNDRWVYHERIVFCSFNCKCAATTNDTRKGMIIMINHSNYIVGLCNKVVLFTTIFICKTWYINILLLPDGNMYIYIWMREKRASFFGITYIGNGKLWYIYIYLFFCCCSVRTNTTFFRCRNLRTCLFAQIHHNSLRWASFSHRHPNRNVFMMMREGVRPCKSAQSDYY